MRSISDGIKERRGLVWIVLICRRDRATGWTKSVVFNWLRVTVKSVQNGRFVKEKLLSAFVVVVPPPLSCSTGGSGRVNELLT